MTISNTNVVIPGAFMTRFAKQLDRSFGSLAREAAAGVLEDAGIEGSDVEFVAFGNAAAGILTGQEMIRAQTALAGSSLEGVPMVNVENACASSSSAFQQAWLAVASGHCDVALAMGCEKMTHADKTRAAVALSRAVDIEELVAERGEGVLVAGAGPLFMEIYAGLARDYAKRTGATARDFAAIAAKSHSNGSHNPKAQYQRAMSVDEVLESRAIIDPLTLAMCAPIGDGSAALLLCSEEFARARSLHGPRVLACSLASGRRDGPSDVVERAALRAYESAGVGPEDVDVVEVHDAASPAELIACEELGLAKPGEALAMLRDGETRIGGRLPINPSGGLVCKGHPIGATGCAQLVELVDQLRGRAGGRQVEGARIALAENAGGWLRNGPAAAVVTLLGSDAARSEARG
jgi:acetyl-CoA acetyltransferase